jgi:hypothetical protein
MDFIYKGFVSFAFTLLLAAIGWVAVTITEGQVKIAELTLEVKRLDVTISTVNSSLVNNYYTRLEAEYELSNLRERIKNLERR